MFKSIVKVLSLSIFFVLLGYLLGITTPSSTFAAKGIQYRIIDLSSAQNLKQVEAMFNKMGAEGWELVEWGKQPEAVFRK